MTSAEYEEVKSHLTKGFEILSPVSSSLRRVVDIVLAHHDKYGGGGYRTTQGTAIPIEARVLSVADVYDALTSDRPYRYQPGAGRAAGRHQAGRPAAGQ